MTNSDDPKFDDIQNPDEELDISMFFEDNDKVDESIDLDFPDESLHGENTQPYADELDMFADLENQVTDDFAMAELFESEQAPDFALEDVVEVKEAADEDTAFAFDDLELVTEPVEQMEMIDNPVLAAIEDMPVVEDKKAKKAREKAEKTQAAAQAKAEKAQALAQAKAAKAQAKADKAAGNAQAKADKATGKAQTKATGEDAPVVEDKKAKKAREKAEKVQALAQAKAEKAQAKAQAKTDKAAGIAPKEKPAKAEKPPKAKREKKPKEPGDKQPKNTAALAFMAGLMLMLLAFGGVNAYAVMKHGIGGAKVFLAIFDGLAVVATGIAIGLRRSKDTVTASEVSLGIAAISLIVGCMFVLANLAYNLLN